MRLVIVIGCLITLIFISRWYTLSDSPEPAENDSQVADSIVNVEPVLDSAVVPSTFDRPILLPAIKAKRLVATRKGEFPKRTHRSDATRKLGVKAENARELIRAEYEVPTHTGKVLMTFQPQALLEIKELPCEDPGMTRLEVTTSWQGQEAMCDFLDAFFPQEQTSGSEETNLEDISGQAISVAVD